MFHLCFSITASVYVAVLWVILPPSSFLLLVDFRWTLQLFISTNLFSDTWPDVKFRKSNSCKVLRMCNDLRPVFQFLRLKIPALCSNFIRKHLLHCLNVEDFHFRSDVWLKILNPWETYILGSPSCPWTCLTLTCSNILELRCFTTPGFPVRSWAHVSFHLLKTSTIYAILPLDVNECLVSQVYSRLTHSVPGMDSGYAAILTRINECEWTEGIRLFIFGVRNRRKRLVSW